MRPVTCLLLVLALSVSACGKSSSPSSTTGTTPTSPTGPTPPPPSVPVVLAVFADPSSSFSTSDVRDSGGQIIRFDTASNSMIWALDGRMFAGYPVLDGYFIRADKFFQVRFGTQDGERRAYFTEAERGTICDVVVTGVLVQIFPTNLTVPNP